MAEDTKTQTKKVAKKVAKKVEKAEAPKEETKPVETPKETTESKEAPKKTESKKPEVKDKAVANAYSLRMSLKHAKYICKMIKGKTPDTAVEMLANVVKGKQPVKMTPLEVGHQKGKGIAGARYPKNAAAAISDIVKQLKANAAVNGIETPIITIAMANQASRPMKRGGKQSKRAHLHLEAQDKIKLIEKKKK